MGEHAAHSGAEGAAGACPRKGTRRRTADAGLRQCGRLLCRDAAEGRSGTKEADAQCPEGRVRGNGSLAGSRHQNREQRGSLSERRADDRKRQGCEEDPEGDPAGRKAAERYPEGEELRGGHRCRHLRRRRHPKPDERLKGDGACGLLHGRAGYEVRHDPHAAAGHQPKPARAGGGAVQGYGERHLREEV